MQVCVGKLDGARGPLLSDSRSPIRRNRLKTGPTYERP